MPSNEKIKLLDLGLDELSEFLDTLGEKPYRREQIASWLFRRKVKNFSAMTDISLPTRNLLSERSVIGPMPKVVLKETSIDNATKLLNELSDGQRVESVLIPEEDRQTLCVSSQVGCALGCSFCRTGTMGIRRNLSMGEILGQITAAQEISPISNIVFMGMGEPMMNLVNLKKALEVILNPKLCAFSHKQVTVSTVGIIPELLKFGQSHPKVPIAISLNSADQGLREKLMPIAKKYPLNQLKDALLSYPLPKNRRLTIAYVLIDKVNDSKKDALSLIRFVSGLRVKINLIAFNPWEGSPFNRPTDENVEEFRNILLEKNFTAIVRKSRGSEVLGACGQLAQSSK
jgi:23S rRNA (adenine2503-C2)-methyltransferase